MKTAKEIPKHLWHIGMCDVCYRRFVLIWHLNYDKQSMKQRKKKSLKQIRDFRICKKCLVEAFVYEI